MAEPIVEGNPLWETLHKIWLEQGKPGYINRGDELFRVLTPSENVVQFHSHGGPEMLYESRSTKGFPHG